MAGRPLTFFASSPRQTFMLFPALVIAAGLARGRVRVRFPWLLVMAAGFGLYRAAGSYRGAIAGGHGFDSTPSTLVTDGPYAYTRNPMYLGHLVFLAGLAGATGSRLAVLLLLRQLVRFSDRVAKDERKLERLFGDDYRAYVARVPRWIPDVYARASASRPAANSGASSK